MTVGKNCNLTIHPLGDDYKYQQLRIGLLAITSASSTHKGGKILVDIPLGKRKLGLVPLATV